MTAWKRTLWLMLAAQMIISLARSSAFPFMPLLLIQLGVRPIASVEVWAGWITSIGFLMGALTAPLWGALADRVGRKAMVVRSSVAICICTGLLGFATDAWQVFVLRALTGIFSGFSASAMALVGTQVPEESLGFSLGWMATAGLVGSLIGPMVGGFLADTFHDFRTMFLITAIGALIASMACLMFVREDRSHSANSSRKRRPFWVELGELVRHPGMAPMFAVILLAQVCALGVSPVVAILVRELVHGQNVATYAGAAVAITGVADVIASPWLGKRSDRIGYRKVLLISLAGGAAFTLPQALAGSIWAFLALRFGVGIFIGGVLPTANAWIGRMFSREERGRVYGLTSSATLLGQAIGPLLGGGIAAQFGIPAVFVVIGGLMAFNLAWVALAVRAPISEPA